MKKINLIITILISFLIFGNYNAYALENNSSEYTIESYDVDIIVHENNTLDIKETITTNFKISKHGIYRKIPLRNTVIRNDKTVTKNRTEVTNVSVNAPYKESKNNNYYTLRIGDEKQTLTGEHEYIIKYTYNLGRDPLKDIDEFYYNIIGTEWDTTISNITFHITMPKSFDKEKVGFSTGTKEKIGSNRINFEYKEEEKSIYGIYNETLNPEEAITIRIQLPEGYFVGAKDAKADYSLISIMIFVPIILLIASLLIWIKYGKDEEIVETVEFYPPNGLNSLEVGYIYKGIAENNDIVSLLIYLASKGYIKISKLEKNVIEDNDFLGKDEYIITKLKDYDGNNENEKIFFDGLFPKYNEKNISTTLSKLRKTFYITVNQIENNINTIENNNKIFEDTSSKTVIIFFMMILSLITIVCIPNKQYNGSFELFETTYGILVFIAFCGFGFIKGMPPVYGLFWIVIVLLGLGNFIFTMVYEPLTSDSLTLISFIFGIICIIGMGICLFSMSKRNKQGSKIFGKIKGFKNFLEVAEKERLEALVEENPEYFYDILPYTYVLKVSDKWIKKFETLTLMPPTWYSSDNHFDMLSFTDSMSDFMSSANKISSPPQSSNKTGSGFSSDTNSSGGGSSGGGSGGGGGGSW